MMLYLTIFRVYGLPILWSGLKTLAFIMLLVTADMAYHSMTDTDPVLIGWIELLIDHVKKQP